MRIRASEKLDITRDFSLFSTKYVPYIYWFILAVHFWLQYFMAVLYCYVLLLRRVLVDFVRIMKNHGTTYHLNIIYTTLYHVYYNHDNTSTWPLK